MGGNEIISELGNRSPSGDGSNLIAVTGSRVDAPTSPVMSGVDIRSLHNIPTPSMRDNCHIMHCFLEQNRVNIVIECWVSLGHL